MKDHGRGYIIPFAKVDQAFIDSKGEFDVYEKMVYVVLSRFLNDQNGDVVFPSIDLVSELVGGTKPTIIKALKGLEEKGLIQIEKIKSNGINKRNLYHLKPYGTPVAKTKEEEPEDKIPYKEIVEYLNQKAEKDFKHTSKDTQKHIRGRWRDDGFRLDDFKKVIDNMVSKWKGDGTMDEYLRPKTLFGTKFESYLNVKPSKPSGPFFPKFDPPQSGQVMTEEERLALFREVGIEG